MKFLVIHNGEPWQSLAATSLIRGLKHRHENCLIDWATSVDSYCLFQFNKNLSEVYIGLGPFKGSYDVAINLTPTIEAVNSLEKISAISKIGFIKKNDHVGVSDSENEYMLQVFSGKENTSKNIFQMYYRLADMKWKGEGYDLSYFPRNRMKKRRTGIAVKDVSLRSYVKENLNLDYSELWHVPLRSDLLKRIDEINRVKHLITDDLFCVHAGIAMRKHVEFLDMNNFNMSIEFFSKGHSYKIDHGPK